MSDPGDPLGVMLLLLPGWSRLAAHSFVGSSSQRELDVTMLNGQGWIVRHLRRAQREEIRLPFSHLRAEGNIEPWPVDNHACVPAGTKPPLATTRAEPHAPGAIFLIPRMDTHVRETLLHGTETWRFSALVRARRVRAEGPRLARLRGPEHAGGLRASGGSAD